MAAQFALRLQKQITKGKIKCNLKGVSLGDSWISPIDSVLTWAPFLYSTSLIDNAGFAAVNASAYAVKTALDNSEFAKATLEWDKTETVIAKETNGVSFYNILETETSSSSYVKAEKSGTPLQIGLRHLSKYHSDPLATLMNGEIKKMLRIIPENVTWGGQSGKVFEALSEDFMKPVVRIVEALLNNSPLSVNVYSGQLDLIVDTMGTTQWVENLNWAGIPSWKKAVRQPIMLNNSTEAFKKSFKSFSFYWILKAGHMVPLDAPETALEMLQIITGLKNFKN
jgi:serine carboxypeptidase 1